MAEEEIYVNVYFNDGRSYLFDSLEEALSHNSSLNFKGTYKLVKV